MPFTVSGHSMIKLNHSTVFIIGGFQNDIISNRTWIADPLNGFEMIEGPSLNVERYGHSCGKMISNGKIVLVVAGGRDQFRYLESIEILDPSSGRGWIIGTFNNIVNFSHLFDVYIDHMTFRTKFAFFLIWLHYGDLC